MRFLVDEDLPRSLARRLSCAGLDALDVRDAGLRGHTDSEVAARAQADGRVLVSADLGFANILVFPPGTHPGIVVARLPNEMPTAEVCERIVAKEAIEEHAARHDSEVVTAATTRVADTIDTRLDPGMAAAAGRALERTDWSTSWSASTPSSGADRRLRRLPTAEVP